MMDALSLSSNQVSAPGIRAPLCGSHLSLVVLTGTLTLAVVLPSPDSSHDDEFDLRSDCPVMRTSIFFKFTTDLPLSSNQSSALNHMGGTGTNHSL